MNQFKNIQVKSLEKCDLDQVADIHLLSFPDSMLSKFGHKAILRYYQWQVTPPNQCYAFGVFIHNDLKGFCFAGSLRNAEIYFIRENFFYS